MIDTITRYLSGVSDQLIRRALFVPLSAVGDRMSSKSLRSAGLAIKAAGSPLAKTGANDYYAICRGSIVRKAASTDLAALSGTVANNTFNTFSFFVDGAGVFSTVIGAGSASLNGVRIAGPQPGQAQLGILLVNPTSGDFIGGTSAIDGANPVFFDTVGAFDPTILV